MHKIRWMLAIMMLIVGCGGDGSSSSSGGTAVAPPAPASKLVLLADFNGDAAVDSADAVAILQYLFQNGPAHASGELCVRIESCPRTCGL